MQTLRLPPVGLRDLRAISRGHSPRRWRPQSMQASTWKGAPPLPNLPKPTRAVGSRPAPAPRHWVGHGPALGAGLPLALASERRASVCPVEGHAVRRVCPWQTAHEPIQYPAPHKAGDIGSAHVQARRSGLLEATRSGLSSGPRRLRCEARVGGRTRAGPGASMAVRRSVSLAVGG